MYRHKKITVCLPCRNEANHLHEVVKRIPRFVDEVVVISNDSQDDTVRIARELRLKVIEDDRKISGIGYGFAHMTGIANATGDIVVGADGDATYPLENLARIIDHLVDNELDFISCNRYPLQAGVKIPFKLRLGVSALNWEVRMLYGIKINDILSGMWVFRRSIASDLKLTMGEWNLSPQIKLNAILSPLIRFAEFGIVPYPRMGKSNQTHYKTGFQHLWWIFKNRLTTRFEWKPVQ